MTLDEIRKLVEAATLGPWFANGPDVATKPGVGAGYPPKPESVASLDDGEYIENRNGEADARFIAAARTLLPALLEAYEVLETLAAQDSGNPLSTSKSDAMAALAKIPLNRLDDLKL